MEFVARVILTGFDGAPAEAALSLEAYDLGQNAWRAVGEMLKPFRAAPKVSKERGRFEIAVTLNETAFMALFGATAFFRLVTVPGREGGQAQVIQASGRVVSTPERIEVDFGTILFLGELGGFVAVPGEGGNICAGVVLAAEDSALASAQRRFYARPLEIEEIAAERDAAQARLAELDKQLAAGRNALAACEASGAKLTRENAALVRQAERNAAELQACVTERARLSEQLAVATGRAAAADADLKACATERERLSADLAVRTKELAAVTAERDACSAERTRLTGQLAAARAQAAASEASLETCVAERDQLAAEVAARTGRLAAVTTERDACIQARETLESQVAQARAALDNATRQLEDLKAELRQAVDASGRAANDLTACRERAAALEAAVAERNAELEACRLAGAEADRRARAADEARAAQDDRLLAIEAELQLRTVEMAEHREQASTGQAYVDRLREAVIAETAKASAAGRQLDAVRRQHWSEAPATDVIAKLATSVGEVNRELAAGSIAYRLGRTDIRLKAFLSSDGGRISFPDAGHRFDERVLTEIGLELFPDDAPPVPDVGEAVVPDLLGLTETAVIRVLSSLFLKADKATETVADPARHGRALHQIPAAGSPAARGQPVLVVYGALETMT